MNEFGDWLAKIQAYCLDYNIQLDYLPDVLNDPKVIPMIRGKSFEYSAVLALRQVLSNRFEVTKLRSNPQLGTHDEDVTVHDTQRNLQFSVECKLANKGSYRFDKKRKLHTLQVKCMRSRTLGVKQQQRLAPLYGISIYSLSIHSDSYRVGDFDTVVTSIGNAFYKTDEEKRFVWSPSEEGKRFLHDLSGDAVQDLRAFAYQQMYIAWASDLAPTYQTQRSPALSCRRKNCILAKTNFSCGFIPNYPVIQFEVGNSHPLHPWYPLDNAQHLFSESRPFRRAQAVQEILEEVENADADSLE
jgi:hypothetical protein